MKITEGPWKGWSVHLEYTDAGTKIEEYAPTYLSAKRTGRDPLHVAYAEVKSFEQPFSIVVVQGVTQPASGHCKVTCLIDGELGSPTLVRRDGRRSKHIDTWVDNECGNYYDKNYKFSPIIFLQDGPIPKEILYYGSIMVTLEEFKHGEDLEDEVVCTGNKPLGLLDDRLKTQTTDAYVDGEVVDKSMPVRICDGHVVKSVPKATVVFKYGSTDTLMKNGIISHKEDGAARPKTVYGGSSFKPSADPLTVIYDPEAPSKSCGVIRLLRLQLQRLVRS